MENYQDLHPKPLKKSVKTLLNILFIVVLVFSFAPKVFVNRANQYYEKGNFNSALFYYNLTIWISPTHPTAYYWRGLTHTHLEQYNAALDDYSMAIKINPSFAAAYIGKCNVHRLQKYLDLAIIDCTKAIELGTNEAAAYLLRGLTYLAKENNDELAEIDLARAVEIDANNPYSYCLLGIAYMRTHKFSEAVVSFEKGIKLDNNNEVEWCPETLINAKQVIKPP